MKQISVIVCATTLTFALCTSLTRAETMLIKPALMLTSQHSSLYHDNINNLALIHNQVLPTLIPMSINLDTNSETFGFKHQQVISERNYFFEFSIIFNDKLQQLIAFFTRNDDSDEVSDELGSNNFSTQAECTSSSK